jgi:hypothetical protein
MNTHSVNLDYDLAEAAVLRDSIGASYRATSWSNPNGGHHVSGSLIFDKAAALIEGEPEFIELELSSIGGSGNRIFRWNL